MCQNVTEEVREPTKKRKNCQAKMLHKKTSMFTLNAQTFDRKHAVVGLEALIRGGRGGSISEGWARGVFKSTSAGGWTRALHSWYLAKRKALREIMALGLINWSDTKFRQAKKRVKVHKTYDLLKKTRFRAIKHVLY